MTLLIPPTPASDYHGCDPGPEARRVGDPFADIVMITRSTPWRATSEAHVHAPGAAPRRPSAGVAVVRRVGPPSRGCSSEDRSSCRPAESTDAGTACWTLNSVAKCRAKRSASSSGGGASISRPSRATSRPRSDARPCSLKSPSLQRSRTARPVCKTACTLAAQRLSG